MIHTFTAVIDDLYSKWRFETSLTCTKYDLIFKIRRIFFFCTGCCIFVEIIFVSSSPMVILWLFDIFIGESIKLMNPGWLYLSTARKMNNVFLMAKLDLTSIINDVIFIEQLERKMHRDTDDVPEWIMNDELCEPSQMKNVSFYAHKRCCDVVMASHKSALVSSIKQTLLKTINAHSRQTNYAILEE